MMHWRSKCAIRRLRAVAAESLARIAAVAVADGVPMHIHISEQQREVDQCMDYLENQSTNVFCAGHSALEDGQILVAGGHYEGTGNNVGLEATNLFRPSSNEWLGLPDGVPNMNFPRWYPTVTTLGDGRALVVSGSHSLCSGGDRNGLWCEDLPCPNGTCSPASAAGHSTIQPRAMISFAIASAASR